MDQDFTHPSEDYVRDCYSLDTVVTNQILRLYDMVLDASISEDNIANIIDELENEDVPLGIQEETAASENIEKTLKDEYEALQSNAYNFEDDEERLRIMSDPFTYQTNLIYTVRGHQLRLY